MKKKIFTGVGVLVVVVLLYAAGIGFYADRFQANTKFGAIDISNLSLPAAEAKVQEDINKQQINLTENGQEVGQIKLTELETDIDVEKTLNEAYLGQDPNQWIVHFVKGETYTNNLTQDMRIEKSSLKAKLEELGLEEGREPAKNATIEYAKGQGYYVEKEEAGTELDMDRVADQILEQVANGNYTIELNQSYEQPEVTAEDEKIAKILERINEIADTKVTLEISDDEVTIDRDQILEWIYFDPSNDVVINEGKVREYIDELNEKYSTYSSPRTFKSTLQGEVQVPAGTLGWSIDKDDEAHAIASDLLKSKDVKREAHIMGSGYGSSNDVGDSYIEVDLTNQTMFVYKNGNLVVETPIVSGLQGIAETVPGAYMVWNKQVNATLVGTRQQDGVDYRQPVSYWIPFDDTGQGIHDANWQGAFGGDVFVYGGSQGCINTPPGIMGEVFEAAEVGMPVIVFH